MSEPVEPTAPDGYSFLTSDLDPLVWQHPNAQYSWVWPQEGGRFVLVHDTCGAFVAVAKVETHDAWHASLGG